MDRLFLAWQWLLDTTNAFWRSEIGFIIVGTLFTTVSVIVLWLLLEHHLQNRK